MLLGKQAPDFKTEAYLRGQIREIELSDYNGKWVTMFFYPGCFTFVCPTELAMLAEAYDEFTEIGAEVLSVSCDSVYSSKAWHEEELSKMVKGGIPFPMLADQGGEIGKAYDVYDAAVGQNVRGRFIIDPDGVVKAVEVLPPEVGRNIEEIIRQIQAFQHVKETGEQTPAGWFPGAQSFAPSIELAGKVWSTWKPPK
jgi:peroxiredoxin (alkyl hydroperoxide reductase subunit C)